MPIETPPSRFVDLDGPVHYVEWEGPPERTFVLVHGLGGSLLSWLAVAPGLARHGRVLAMDLPGFGQTERDGRRSRVSDLRATVSGFVHEVARGPVVLVGNSMGGGISMLEGALEPEVVQALVLSNSVFPWRRGAFPAPIVMPGAQDAPPDPAIAEVAVPEPVVIRDARTLDVAPSSEINQEVTVLGLSLATGFWGVLVGLYAYVLPLILYSAWVSIALWDLVRQEAVPNRTRITWMLVVLVVPLLGPIAYYAFGRSPIQRSLRLMLVVGGMAIYVALTAVAIAVGSG